MNSRKLLVNVVSYIPIDHNIEVEQSIKIKFTKTRKNTHIDTRMYICVGTPISGVGKQQEQNESSLNHEAERRLFTRYLQRFFHV